MFAWSFAGSYYAMPCNTAHENAQATDTTTDTDSRGIRAAQGGRVSFSVGIFLAIQEDALQVRPNMLGELL